MYSMYSLFKRSLCLFVLLNTLLIYGINLIFADQISAQITFDIDSSLSVNGLANLKDLISNVGAEFNMNPNYKDSLNNLGIRRMRLINVDLRNEFLGKGKKLRAPWLESWLNWCKFIGVEPHIIIGQGIPPALSTYNNDYHYGPSDWDAYKDYIWSFFHYVIMEKGFKNATWEVANEPDLNSAPISDYPMPAEPFNEKAYQSYCELYNNITTVARAFENRFKVKVPIGGPACTPLSFKLGKFNWYERFLQDVKSKGMKLDFLTIHLYGCTSSIHNSPNNNPPPYYETFDNVILSLKDWIKQYKPGTPIWITEYGPSAVIDMTPMGMHNLTNVGAAWSAEFIYSMFMHQIGKAFLLVTSDQGDNWAWPALFHQDTPKPLYYVLNMFQKLEGNLVKCSGGSDAVGGIAARSQNTITVLLWNFNWLIYMPDGGQELSQMEKINITISGLSTDSTQGSIKRTLISEHFGNPYFAIFDKSISSEPLKDEFLITKAFPLEFTVEMPPSSVMLLEIDLSGLSMAP